MRPRPSLVEWPLAPHTWTAVQAALPAQHVVRTELLGSGVRVYAESVGVAEELLFAGLDFGATNLVAPHRDLSCAFTLALMVSAVLVEVVAPANMNL